MVKKKPCAHCFLSYYLGGSFNHAIVLPLIALMYPLAIAIGVVMVVYTLLVYTYSALRALL
jgi:hypothetical protein